MGRSGIVAESVSRYLVNALSKYGKCIDIFNRVILSEVRIVRVDQISFSRVAKRISGSTGLLR